LGVWPVEERSILGCVEFDFQVPEHGIDVARAELQERVGVQDGEQLLCLRLDRYKPKDSTGLRYDQYRELARAEARQLGAVVSHGGNGIYETPRRAWRCRRKANRPVVLHEHAVQQRQQAAMVDIGRREQRPPKAEASGQTIADGEVSRSI